MQRREFIRLVSGAAAAWPFTVRAQQGDRIRRIGVLTGTRGPEDADSKARNAAFEQALQQLGWTQGRNVRIDYLSVPKTPSVGFARESEHDC
jgi:hypothetical protein